MVGLNNSTFLTSILGAVGMSASRCDRISPKWRPHGHSGSWCITGDARRKNSVLAEYCARLFSWKHHFHEISRLAFQSCQFTTSHCTKLCRFVIPCCPVYDNYVTELCQLTFPSCPTYKQSLLWVISVHLPKVSNLQLVSVHLPKVSNLQLVSVHLPKVSNLQLVSVHLPKVSNLWLLFHRVFSAHISMLCIQPVTSLNHLAPFCHIRCFSVFSVMKCSRVTCTEVSEMEQLPQNRWQIVCYHNCIPVCTHKLLFIQGNKRKPAWGCKSIVM